MTETSMRMTLWTRSCSTGLARLSSHSRHSSRSFASMTTLSTSVGVKMKRPYSQKHSHV